MSGLQLQRATLPRCANSGPCPIARARLPSTGRRLRRKRRRKCLRVALKWAAAGHATQALRLPCRVTSCWARGAAGTLRPCDLSSAFLERQVCFRMSRLLNGATRMKWTDSISSWIDTAWTDAQSRSVGKSPAFKSRPGMSCADLTEAVIRYRIAGDGPQLLCWRSTRPLLSNTMTS